MHREAKLKSIKSADYAPLEKAGWSQSWNNWGWNFNDIFSLPQSAFIIRAWWIFCCSHISHSLCYSGQFNNLGITTSLPLPPLLLPAPSTGASAGTRTANLLKADYSWSLLGSRWQPHCYKCLEPKEGCEHVAVVCVCMWVCVYECMFKCLACPLCGIFRMINYPGLQIKLPGVKSQLYNKQVALGKFISLPAKWVW